MTPTEKYMIIFALMNLGKEINHIEPGGGGHEFQAGFRRGVLEAAKLVQRLGREFEHNMEV